LDHIQSETADS